MHLTAIIPTINEADTIGDLVRALDKMCDQVIDTDGSPDGRTKLAAHAAGATYCTADRPGLGPAYEIAHACTPLDWYVLHIDAGGSHDPADVVPMMQLADMGMDVVIGSRFCPGGEHHGPWHRRVTSRLASAALNFISLADIADWTSGYRIYSPRARAILAAHDFTTTGHAWQIESLAVLRRAGCRIVETPITYRSSVSHLSRGRVTEAAKLWLRLAWG